MAEPVSVGQLEAHLRLPVGGSGQGPYLEALLTAARRLIEHHTSRVIVGDEPTLTDADDLAVVSQAILLLAGHWFEHRDGTDALPPAVTVLIAPFRRWAL